MNVIYYLSPWVICVFNHVLRKYCCETFDVSSCNQTGLWKTYDEMIENICHNGQGLPILHRIPYNGGFVHGILRLKHIACIHCNLGSKFNDSSLTCIHYAFTGM